MTEDEQRLPAGGFTDWLVGMERALAGVGESDVPCGTCTACCTSSQFVHIEPDETATLAQVPAALLFPAPRLPRGHVVLGYDERGRCPMLRDAGCSIYEHRPRTCRTYDCRVFPAAGVVLEEATKVAIAAQARRWRFEHLDEADRCNHDSVLAAAAFVRSHPELLSDGVMPAGATQHAVLAVRLHALFHENDVEPAPEAIAAHLVARVEGGAAG